ncbi:unnamed protein product [Scytosiphon promiscuus]
MSNKWACKSSSGRRSSSVINNRNNYNSNRRRRILRRRHNTSLRARRACYSRWISPFRRFWLCAGDLTRGRGIGSPAQRGVGRM